MSKKDPLPIWSYPLILVLLGIVILAGNLPITFQIAVSAETLAYISYLYVRSRSPQKEVAPWTSNPLALFPGHLLLLFALSIVMGENTVWIVLWMIIPAASVLYDWIAPTDKALSPVRVSMLTGLYSIIWGDVFVLLERVIALGRGLEGKAEIKLIVLFGVLGVAFLARGVSRHLSAIKSSKEW
jgi:hypothetical protein